MQQSTILAKVHTLLADRLPGDRPVQVLEAGGGSFTHINLPSRKHVTVVDISSEQLANNTYADVKVLGDIEDPATIPGRYDLIVCFDVLEHLGKPEAAFGNMVRALAPGGVLIIGSPNLFSLKGLVTRLTPFWFHVWYYRAIRGDKAAGTPGNAPFPVFLRRAMTPPALGKAALNAGLRLLLQESYIGPAVNELQERWPLVYRLYRLPAAILRMERTDFLFVARRPIERQPVEQREAHRPAAQRAGLSFGVPAEEPSHVEDENVFPPAFGQQEIDPSPGLMRSGGRR